MTLSMTEMRPYSYGWDAVGTTAHELEAKLFLLTRPCSVKYRARLL
jgi:hypothetical protein